METSPPVRARAYTSIRPVIWVLLACNAVYYLYAGTAAEAVDTVAWMALLVAFEIEMRGMNATHASAHALRLVRLAAALAIAWAAAGYYDDHAWLDFANLLLWIAVIVMLEFELRRPAFVACHRPGFAATAALLYAALALLAALWAWGGAWFDAYDAVLWLAAFAIIEMNVLAAATPSIA